MQGMSKLATAVTTTLFATCILASDSVAADDLLHKIKARGTMKVCNLPYPPWNVKNPITNEWEGINVDIAMEIAKTLKVKLEHVDADFATIVQSVITAKCDFSIGATWVTPARAELITFTGQVAPEGIGVFVHANSPIKSIEEIDQPGKIVATPTGSATEKWSQETFKKATRKSIVGSQMAAALMEVAAGRADAAGGGYYGNLGFIKANPGFKVRALPGVIFNAAPLAYILPPREYFLRDYLNAALISLDASGRKQAIIDKWTKVTN